MLNYEGREVPGTRGYKWATNHKIIVRHFINDNIIADILVVQEIYQVSENYLKKLVMQNVSVETIMLIFL